MRIAALGLILFAASAFGWEGTQFDPVGPDLTWNAKVNPVFYDHPLLEKQYGFGLIGNMVTGALGFYIGNAFEGGLFSSRAHEGYLSFTGIRYRNWRGPFWGGGSGMLLGTTLTVFFMGDADEEQGSIFWTLVGNVATTAAAFALADWAGVQQQREWLPLVPLVLVPPLGAVTGYQIARWFNDKKRVKATETGAVLLPPRLAVVPMPQGLGMRFDAINLSF